jgi:uncharacterized protein (TIGR00288 family)
MASSRLSAKNGPEEPISRLAVLIDADNVPASSIDEILTEVSRFGEATVKRIYGDFTAGPSSSWNEVLQEYAIKPVQQFAYTPRKNATDIALVIDAMDLLYTRNFDGFCLVSSDSDFTGLATRIREEGLTVLGIGEEKAPSAFRKACDKFIPIKAPSPSAAKKGSGTTKADAAEALAPDTPASPDKPARTLDTDSLLEAWKKASDKNGWAHMGTFGQHLNMRHLDISYADLGCKNLTDFVKAKSDLFTTEERTVPGRSNKIMYLRAK